MTVLNLTINEATVLLVREILRETNPAATSDDAAKAIVRAVKKIKNAG